MIYRGWFFQTIEKHDKEIVYKAVKDREAIIGTAEEIKRCIDERELKKMREEL